MASNGLVANQSNTEFLLLNANDNSRKLLQEVTVGEVNSKRTDSTKLLGIFIEETQEWNEHFRVLKNSLNQKLFIIRRIMRQVPKYNLMSIVHSLRVSKLWYGLQLCFKVRTSD